MELYALGVDPSYRSEGIGKALSARKNLDNQIRRLNYMIDRNLTKDPADVEAFDRLFPLYFTRGAPPMLPATDGMTPDQLRELQDALDSLPPELADLLRQLLEGQELDPQQMSELRDALQQAQQQQQQREQLETIRDSADSLLRVINDVLDFSKIEAGKLDLDSVEFDLRAWLRQTTEIFELQARQKGIRLERRIDDQAPARVTGDPLRLSQVLINLVGNATKFTHKGGITVSAAVKGGDLIIAVADTGSGIAEEDKERLFKKFSQVGSNYSRPVGGTGLGLYISKQIVEGLKGKIWLDSKVGAGSTFFFSIPIS